MLERGSLARAAWVVGPILGALGVGASGNSCQNEQWTPPSWEERQSSWGSRNVNLYVETSVWNMRVDEEEVNRQKRHATEAFFTEVDDGRHRVYVSPLVLGEVAADPDLAHRRALQDGINRCEPTVLEQTERVLELGRAYVEQGIVPEKHEDDAVHIAYAVLYRLDAIVSWNMAHIVKVRTRRNVSRYNRRVGLHVPEIATPEEVTEDV